MRFLIIFLFTAVLFWSCGSEEETSTAVLPDNTVAEDSVIIPDTDGAASAVDNAAVSDDTGALEDKDAAASDIEEEPDIDWAVPEFNDKPVALIITTEALREPFDKLAALHTLTDILTEVETVENICGTKCSATDHRLDAAKFMKDAIIARKGLKYVILGGDINDIPSRLVHDKYSNVAAGTYEEDFYTDYYYGDLADWDLSKDGIYAQDTVDKGIDYKPDLAVSRISVSTAQEAEIYYEKVIKYVSDYNTAAVKKALLLANIATNFNGLDINAGYYFEATGRTVSAIPQDFTITRLYAQTLPPPSLSSKALSNSAQIAAYNEGYNIVVHNGHGFPSLLNCEQTGNEFDFTGDMAYQLTNQTLSIYLSCACQAGQFESPFTWHYTNSSGQAKEMVFPKDSAGELLMNAPQGGAIAYLGNTTTGLGLAGGSQLIDEMLKYVFTTQNPILGDALYAGHMNLKDSDTFQPPILTVAIPVIDRDSYEWTQKATVLLGDLLIPVWTQPLPKAAAVTADIEKEGTEGIRLSVTIPQNLAAEKIMAYAGGEYYLLDNTPGATTEYYIKGADIQSVLIGYYSKTTQYFFHEFPVK